MSQNFFAALVGERVFFINPLGRRNSCIVTQKGVIGLHKLQADGYKFLPAIHNSGDNTCVSCEG